MPARPNAGLIQKANTWPNLALESGWQALGVALLISLFCFGAFFKLQYDWNWSVLWKYKTKFIQGWLVTVGISLVSLVMSTALAVCVALAQRSRIPFFRYLAQVHVELIRGTPLLVQILVFFYILADALGVGNRYVVGILCLSLFSSAYLAEMIRAGIESIASTQIESARAIGLSPFQIYRYVIFPQAIRRILPSLAGQFASLIKDSSLLSVIAISEFTLNAQEINANTYSAFESYLPLALGYLILTMPISLWSRKLERDLQYHT